MREYKTASNYAVRELNSIEMEPGLLREFDRYQRVERCLRREDGSWVLRDVPFIEQWDETDKEAILQDLTQCLQAGGVVFGAFDMQGVLAGFANILTTPLGSCEQYRKLQHLYVTSKLRGEGLGRQLFYICAKRAQQLGAQKLYISTHSSEESQAFYVAMGCVDAKEKDPHSAAQEPYDRQMEYVL